MSGRAHPPWRFPLLLLLLFTLSAIVRVGWIAHQQHSFARQALAQHHPHRAIIHFARSIRAWLPLVPNPSRQEMADLLRAIEQQQPKLALEGWRRLRGALLATRNLFGQPNRDLLIEANRHIAHLAAITDEQHKMTPEAIARELSRLLAEYPKDVNRFWGVMQFLLLLAWVGLGCRLIWCWPERTARGRLLLFTAAFASWLGWLGALYLAG